MNTVQMEAYNPNYMGGYQWRRDRYRANVYPARFALFTLPYMARGLYICSSPHHRAAAYMAVCGYHAAQRVLKDIFNKHSNSKP